MEMEAKAKKARGNIRRVRLPAGPFLLDIWCTLK
jgi:hypothetical protein